MLIKLGLLTSKNQCWSLFVIRGDELLQKGQEIGSLESMSKPSNTPGKPQLAAEHVRKWRVDPHGLVAIRFPLTFMLAPGVPIP
ncbi:MAG: hypothetical protein R3E65_07980 [Steroidobacteraceae bacterium]